MSELKEKVLKFQKCTLQMIPLYFRYFIKEAKKILSTYKLCMIPRYDDTERLCSFTLSGDLRISEFRSVLICDLVSLIFETTEDKEYPVIHSTVFSARLIKVLQTN